MPETNGTMQNGTNGVHEETPKLGHPIYHERQMRVICIGAGASGLCFAYKLQRSFEKFSLKIYEKNAGVGGTWFENTYPGCACDYPAHNYTYSFEPKSDWSRVYAGQAEIQGYFEAFKVKYGLDQYCKTQHEVVGAEWNDSDASWEVQVKDIQTGNTFTDTCDILINASGVLNRWRWPDIPGLDTFKGKLLHSARWDNGLDLEGKRVGIIGNGSSGQQITEAIQPNVQSLTVLIRQPTWIFGPFGPEPRDYTKEEIEDFKQNPEALLKYRKQNELRFNTYFESCITGTQAQDMARGWLTQVMKEKIANPNLEELLIPKWAVGCRRPTPGVKYLEAITAENAKVVLGDIKEVTSEGCISQDGTLHELDVLICATGFDTSYKPRFPLSGRKGKSLTDAWAKKPKCYMALAAADMPNYFMFYGPYNPFASGPFLAAMEAQADYMLKWCDRWQTENIQHFTPKKEAIDEFTTFAGNFLQKTVWADQCHSWYKQGGADGRDLLIWPGSGMHYVESISNVRSDDWDVAYNGNRFEWLGSGFSRTELDPTCDMSYYVRNHDDSPFLSREKRRRVQTGSNPKRVKTQEQN